MTPTKGGMTGLPEDDFNRRQKSGDWSIDEHFRDVNYIRTKDSIPNEYLTAGHYENENLTIYNPFLNRFSSLTMSASGNDPSVTCMAYNRHIGHLAVGLNKEPYLRIFDMTTDLMEDVYSGSLIQVTPSIFVKTFQNSDLFNNVLRVKHDLNDELPAVAMLEITSDVSYPYEIEIVDENNISLTFHELAGDISGLVYIYTHENSISYSLSLLTPTTANNIDTYQLDLSDKNFNNPYFQLYDSMNKMIFPAEIRETTANKVYEFDFPEDFNSLGVKILITKGYDSYSDTFIADEDEDSVVINHNLDSYYLFFQVYDMVTNSLIVPDNIHITDNNSILISTLSLEDSRSYKINIIKSLSDAESQTHQTIKRPSMFVKSFENSDLVDNILSIKHNLDDDKPISSMLELTSDVAYPYEIEIIDNTQVDFIFPELSSNVSGRAYIYSHEDSVIYSIDSLFSSTTNNTTVYRLDISILEFTNPHFQMYDSLNRVIFPIEIREIAVNNIYEFDFPEDFDSTDVRVIVTKGYFTYSKEFIVKSEESTVSINHNLDSYYLFYQIYDMLTNSLIVPDNINVKDNNTIVISTESLVDSRSYKINIIKSLNDFTCLQYQSVEVPLSPVFCLEYDAPGDSLFVGTLEAENNNYILEYDTSNYSRNNDTIILNTLPTIIKIDPDNEYLLIGHYTTTLINRNLSLYDYSNNQIIDNYNFNTLKQYTIDSVNAACFIDSRNLLVVNSFYEPYLCFYNYSTNKNMTSDFASIIEDYIDDRVTHIVKTRDDRYLIIAVCQSPYLFILDLEDETILELHSDYFVSSFTSISISSNDQYLCVTQYDSQQLLIFEFLPTKITNITLNQIYDSDPLESLFFFGSISSSV